MTAASLLFLIAGIAAGAAGLWFLRRSVENDLRARLAAAEQEKERWRAEVERAETERARLETRLEAERTAAAEKLALVEEARTRLTEAFKGLSAEALKSNNQSFLELAKNSFEQLQKQAKDDLQNRQQAIDGLVKPLKESLEKVDGKIQEIEKSRASAYGELSEQLKNLSHAQASLLSETTRLSTALRSTATAGTWGELQLRRVVEMAGMTSYCDFAEQETSGGQRADMVVRLPGGQRIVVDAKAPNEAYREAATAADETTRAAKLKEHAAKVRAHVDDLGSKSYWEQFQPSPEFVVLFLPGDQFLAAALQTDAELIDRAISKKVLLATPSTLIALLKAAAYGWRQEAVSENAAQISKLGRELYDRIATFAEHLERVGKGLNTAVSSYNQAVGSFESQLIPGARRFNELGVSGSKALTPPPGVESAPRDVEKRA